MTTFARAAVVAAALTLLAAPVMKAQSGSIRVTIANGPHAGTYEFKEDCGIVNGQIEHAFTATSETPRTSPVGIGFYTVAGKGKPDGFGVQLMFLGQSNRQIKYEVHAMPPGVKNPHFFPNSGRGSVTVRPAGAGKSAAFRGETKDGVRIEGRVVCPTAAGKAE
jgi:hypothetical protein